MTYSFLLSQNELSDIGEKFRFKFQFFVLVLQHFFTDEDLNPEIVNTAGN